MTTVSFPIQVHMKEGAGWAYNVSYSAVGKTAASKDAMELGGDGRKRRFTTTAGSPPSLLFFHGLRDTTSRFPHTKCCHCDLLFDGGGGASQEGENMHQSHQRNCAIIADLFLLLLLQVEHFCTDKKSCGFCKWKKNILGESS